MARLLDWDELPPDVRARIPKGTKLAETSPLLAAARAQRRRNQVAAGSSLEEELALVHQLYERRGRATIERAYLPTKVVQQDNRGRGLRVATGRAAVDFYGTANVAGKSRSIYFDAKSANRASYTHEPKQYPGPGNAVLDGLVRTGTRGLARHDESGGLAASGRAHEALLEELLADPFFNQPPPRSTGRERFGEAYAERVAELGEGLGLSLEDTLATAVELTAASIERSLREFVQQRGKVDAVYASGGGVRNVTLMLALRRRLDGMRLERLDELGVSAGIKEALAFAFLAHLTLCGEPGNVPGATGARHPVVLGSITPGVSPGGARA